ncbi:MULTISPECIES: hypothetical protein [unclassified Mesorhizobium]|uniref:hypothetical protein n=1 Tax=unclassified Mesorhizobium TaxID=325217 RepID=UPI001FDF9152|nr:MULTISPECIES: hypothetical protein [unclassified Mesorhizobium]
MLSTKHLIGGQGRKKPMLGSLWREILKAQTLGVAKQNLDGPQVSCRLVDD